MRFAYPLLWCLPAEAQIKLLGQISGIKAVPDQIWSEWQPSEWEVLTSVPTSKKDEEYIQAHLDAVGRIMSQPPSRSRGNV